MKVYLIRHGQTDGNVQGIHQGWGNSSLTERGRAQAGALAEVMQGKRFDRIICSDLLRTRQICSIVFGDSATVEYDARLREINNSVIGGRSRNELFGIYGDAYLDDCHRLDFARYGGESSQSLLDRTADFLDSLTHDTASKNVAVVSHGGTIRAIIAGVLGMPLNTLRMAIDNCSVTGLEYSGDGWRLVFLNNKKEI